jgi:hypothetical protein
MKKIMTENLITIIIIIINIKIRNLNKTDRVIAVFLFNYIIKVTYVQKYIDDN